VFGSLITMTSEDKSTVKLVIFNGKAESWDNWELGFIARVVIYKYYEILSGDETSPTQAAYKALDKASTDADVKQLIVNYKANSLAYSHLVSSMDMKGDSCRVAIGLLRHSRTIQSLLKDYNECSIKNGQDPADYMCILDNLRAKIMEIDPQESISDKSFTLKILNSLPLSYVSIVEEIEKDINRGITVSITEVRNLLHLK
jgi:hypothetical protein